MRSMAYIQLGSVLGLAFVVGACEQKGESVPTVQEVPVTTPAKPAEVAAPAAASAPPVVAARVLPEDPTTQIPETDVPTEEDYEAEAETLISGENLDDALDELEREIGE